MSSISYSSPAEVAGVEGSLAYRFTATLSGDLFYASGTHIEVSPGVFIDLTVSGLNASIAEIKLYGAVADLYTYILAIPVDFFDSGEAPTSGFPPLKLREVPVVITAEAVVEPTKIVLTPEVMNGETWLAGGVSFTTPVEIFRFTYAKGTSTDGASSWFTSSETPLTFIRSDTTPSTTLESRTFSIIPETIKRNEVSVTHEINKSNIQIDVTKNFEIAKLFISGVPTVNIFVECFRGEADEAGNVLEANSMCFFKGRVVTCTFRGFEATITAEPIYTHIQKAGLRLTYSTMCAHALYDLETCKLPRIAATGVTLAIAAQRNKLTLSGTTSPDVWAGGLMTTTGTFTGGIAEIFVLDQPTSVFLIIKHDANALTLSRPVPNDVVPTDIKIYQGCDHKISTCASKSPNAQGTVGNHLNFGGYPYMIASNPFVGTHVPPR